MGHCDFAEHGGVLVVGLKDRSQDTFVQAVFGDGEGRCVPDVEDSGDGLFVQCVQRFGLLENVLDIQHFTVHLCQEFFKGAGIF